MKVKEFFNAINVDYCLVFGRGITPEVVKMAMADRKKVSIVDLKNVYVHDLEQTIEAHLDGMNPQGVKYIEQPELIVFVTQNVQALDYVDIERIFFAKDGEIYRFTGISEILDNIDYMAPSEIVLNWWFFK